MIKKIVKELLITWLWLTAGLCSPFLPVASAAVAVEASTSDVCGSCSSLQYALTVGAAGTNRLLVVSVVTSVFQGLAPTPTVTSISYGGQGLTKIDGYFNTDATYEDLGRIELWYLVAPPTGNNNVDVTLSGAAGGLLSGAVSLTGADQASPVRSYAKAGSDGVASQISSVTLASAAGDIVLDVVCGGNAVNSTIGATEEYRVNGDTSTVCNNFGGSSQAGAASVTASWNVNGGSTDFWMDFAVSIKPAGSTPALTTTLRNVSLGNVSINR